MRQGDVVSSTHTEPVHFRTKLACATDEHARNADNLSLWPLPRGALAMKLKDLMTIKKARGGCCWRLPPLPPPPLPTSHRSTPVEPDTCPPRVPWDNATRAPQFYEAETLALRSGRLAPDCAMMM